MFGKRHARWFQALVLMSIMTGVIFAASGMVANAAPGNAVTWDDALSAKTTVQDEPGVVWKDWYSPFCQPGRAIVEEYVSRQELDVCHVSSANVQLAVYRQNNEPNSMVYYGLKLPGDTAFHRTNLYYFNHVALLSNDTLIGTKGAELLHGMFSFIDYDTRVIPNSIPNGTPTPYVVYDVRINDSDMYVDSFGNDFYASNIGVSKNEKYAVVQAFGKGLVRVDLTTRNVKLVAGDYTNNGEEVLLAISNDGNKVAVTGRQSDKHRVYVGLDDCGSYDLSTPIIPNRSRCYYADFADQLVSYYGSTLLYNLEFSNGDTQLIAHSWDEQEQRSRKLIFTPDNTNYRLDYLAMGDSYSSGEGDIERDAFGQRYYLPGTNSRPDVCHVSSRSYPFLLRNEWRITSDRMKSIACSGAGVSADYMSPLVGYRGQINRLSGRGNLDVLHKDALDSFTPGHVPQLEFVKKYQPKIVTLTGGGNDIGFAKVLEYCATPSFTDFIPIVNIFTADCGYAKSDDPLQKLLHNAIDTQYGANKKLIEAIKTASPSSKIVLVGYPSFVTHDSTTGCLLNSGSLTINEIKAINSMVDRVNSMLRRVAHDTSITYVDVTNALHGGRICEGSSYMTGVANWLTKSISEEERFHPNAKGHDKIADTIKKANVYKSDDWVPSAGSYLPSTTNSSSAQGTLIGGGSAVKRNGMTLNSGGGLLMPNSQYSITTYSEPKNLGVFMATDDGAVNATVSLDDVEIGRHVLVVEGIDEDGNPKQIYQFIEVRASEDDADGDGIPDDIDTCQYITEWIDEQSGEDVCKVESIRGTDNRVPFSNINVQKPSTVYDDAWLTSTGHKRLAFATPGKGLENGLETVRGNIESIEGDTNIARVAFGLIAIMAIMGGIVYAYKTPKTQSKN